MKDLKRHFEEVGDRQGKLFSSIVLVLVLFLLFYKFLTYPIPPPGQEGILVSLGLPDVGEGDDMPDLQNEEMVDPEPPSTQPEETVEEQPAEEEQVEEVVEETVEEPVEVEQETEPAKDVVTSESAEEIALKKQKEQAEKLAQEEAQKKADAEAKKKAEDAAKKKAIAEAKAKAEAEAKAKAAADAKAKAEYEAKKKQYGNAFGKGKGKTGKPGNQGDPNGDPNAKNLEGISTGKGNIGGGLGSRGVVKTPKISDTSQKEGIIVLKVCVDSNGNVISTSFTQNGSNSSDAQLISIAKKNAKRYKFSKGTMDKQCGTITYEFKLK